MQRDLPRITLPLPARIIGSVFGIGFCGAGLTILGFLWLTPFDVFGSPPLVFRIFGSFVAIIFVVTGGTMAWTIAFGQQMPQLPTPPGINFQPAVGRSSVGAANDAYTCPYCAAPLASKSDVSPLGDVKCPFCHSWFNIHKS